MAPSGLVDVRIIPLIFYWLRLNAAAAAGADNVTGDVTGLIGNQEPRDIGDLVRLANGAQHGLVGGVLP